MTDRTAPLPTQRLAFLDHLRAVGIVMVIGVHAVGYCTPLSPDQLAVFRTFVHAASVPIFFLVDGYLFARRHRHGDPVGYAGMVRRSFLRLVLPWLIFTVAYTTARWAFERAGVLDETLLVGEPWPRVLLRAYGSVYAPQLYFLVSLFLLRLAGPAFLRLVRVRRFAVLVTVSAAVFTAYKLVIPAVAEVLRIEGGQEPILHALWGIQFYLLGIIAQRAGDLVTPRRVLSVVSPLLAVGLVLQDRLGEPGAIAVQFSYLLVLLHGSQLLTRPARGLDWLGCHTMGIYLVHAPVVIKGVSMVLGHAALTPLVSFAAVVAATLVVSAGLVRVVGVIPGGGFVFGEATARRPAP